MRARPCRNTAQGIAKIALKAVQDMLLKVALQATHDDYEDRRLRQRQDIVLVKQASRYKGRMAKIQIHERIMTFCQADYN